MPILQFFFFINFFKIKNPPFQRICDGTKRNPQKRFLLSKHDNPDLPAMIVPQLANPFAVTFILFYVSGLFPLWSFRLSFLLPEWTGTFHNSLPAPDFP